MEFFSLTCFLRIPDLGAQSSDPESYNKTGPTSRIIVQGTVLEDPGARASSAS